MDSNKDYYATLGLTPSADEAVIRAAYKALAQRYHPDRAQGDPTECNARMSEINEAYHILRDKKKREEYDHLRGDRTQSGEAAFEQKNKSGASPLEEDWKTAVEFYPELRDIVSRLDKISWRMAESFRARILESKNFAGAKFVAKKLETEFLQVYFGSDKLIQEFARELILSGKSDAARTLNNAVRVLGEETGPLQIIQTIRGKYDLPPFWEYNRSRSTKGVRAEEIANYKGLSATDVTESVNNGDIRGFTKDGMIYVELDDNGDFVWQQKSKAETFGFELGKWIRNIFVR